MSSLSYDLLIAYLLDELGDCRSTIQFSATALVVTDAFSVGLPSVIYTDAEVSPLLLKT